MECIGLLLVLCSQSKSEFDFFFDYAQFFESDTTARFELYYQFPVADLKFTTAAPRASARYRLLLQFFNNRGDLIAGDVYPREYRSTNGDSLIVGQVSLPVPTGTYKLLLRAEDVQSTNYYTAQRMVDLKPTFISGIHFQNGTHEDPSRTYEAGDSLHLEWELYNPRGAADSFALTIKKDKKVLYAAGAKLKPAPRSNFSTFYSIGNLETGEYQITISAIGREGNELFRRAAVCSIIAPFYLSNSSYQLKVEELFYIASPAEIKHLRTVPVHERLRAWNDFWQTKDPTPGTAKNEARDEYFTKIDYCNENFSKGDRGFRSDRAKVYMRYGQPDEVETHPFDIDRPAYEQWFYYSLNLQFTFSDKTGVGQFELVEPLEVR